MENVDSSSKQGGRRVPLDVRLINPFISGTKEVFEVMAGIPVKRKSLSLKKDYKMFGEISGIMGLTGEAVGSIIISFPKKLADNVVSKFLGIENVESINEDDIRDGVGEILNMIAGKAKTLLASTEYYFKLSIPTVIIGQNYEISHSKDTPCMVVIFEATNLQFVLQVSLAPHKKQE
ncbi:MAG: chemotaxis protein CheX [Epsilonproteobacteria bacterium]|nr:chemotaxis protein CheX [Campylobacterota bacterium]